MLMVLQIFLRWKMKDVEKKIMRRATRARTRKKEDKATNIGQKIQGTAGGCVGEIRSKPESASPAAAARSVRV